MDAKERSKLTRWEKAILETIEATPAAECPSCSKSRLVVRLSDFEDQNIISWYTDPNFIVATLETCCSAQTGYIPLYKDILVKQYLRRCVKP